MKVGVPKETKIGESRVGLVPESCKKLIAKGMAVCVEQRAGEASFFSDAEYRAAGALVQEGPVTPDADLVLKVQPPSPGEADGYREGAVLLCSLLPARSLDAVRKLAARKITILSTDCIPRITRAQSMDTLSSMSSIAGYKALLMAANSLPRYFPMLTTAAGTILPAKVFVIGAGVAGLQAIATAKRLGASVTATDSRRIVAEQIRSLGGKYVGVESDEDAQTDGGFAKELSADFKRKQEALIAAQCVASNVVITTALIGGVSAPRLITSEMVAAMKPGSVIVDLAAEGGGNCELSRPGETTVCHGVTIMAPLNVPSLMPHDSSALFSRNLVSFVLAFWVDAESRLNLDPADEIIKGALIAHGGEVVHGPTREALGESRKAAV